MVRLGVAVAIVGLPLDIEPLDRIQIELKVKPMRTVLGGARAEGGHGLHREEALRDDHLGVD